MRYFCRFGLLVSAVLLAAAAAAESSDATLGFADNDVLVVGTRIVPPFVIQNENGELSGVSIELWEMLAETLGIRYRFEERELGDLISGLGDGSLDASVAALTVTAEREQRVDFTHPFHTTGLAIAVPARPGALTTLQSGLFSWGFLLAVASLAGLLLAVGAALWLVERKKNPGMFGGTPAEGLGASFWWAAVTMTTVGYGDKVPITLAGRIIGLIWMFAAIILISGFTAAIATSLTVSQLAAAVNGPEDLENVRVVTLRDSTSAEYLQSHGIRFSRTDSLETAFNRLVSGEVDALVYDEPILQFISSQDYPDSTEVLNVTFHRQDYAIAVQEGSQLREELNRELLAIIGSERWDETLDRYLGEAMR